MSIQHKRKEANLFMAVSQIISSEITNANISYPTVTGVKLSTDGSHLFVYLSFESRPEKSLAALKNTIGFIKTRLSKMQGLRKVPELDLKLDKAISEGKKIDEILKKIKSEKS